MQQGVVVLKLKHNLHSLSSLYTQSNRQKLDKKLSHTTFVSHTTSNLKEYISVNITTYAIF